MSESAVPSPRPIRVPVRYRTGEAGETSRVVHMAVWTSSAVYLAMCGAELDGHRAEVVVSGMPCMPCVRELALREDRPDRSGRAVVAPADFRLPG
ncbi:hypothetical protein [Saccharopolyspora gloriosae]|uniref:Uncharacterized protein n=1 Tax=Saccharopolyspora gloriosae TaxID=455344 RepID=A0A840NE50_9PSEU|nr:hypothetical protein [Saccharopolyspora gloriosae]MBB5067492.1 hypothetical protein [Saccharopolyspora gloriosae]